MTKTTMTQGEFSSHRGELCPACHSDNLHYPYPEGTVCICNDCRAHWLFFNRELMYNFLRDKNDKEIEQPLEDPIAPIEKWRALVAEGKTTDGYIYWATYEHLDYREANTEYPVMLTVQRGTESEAFSTQEELAKNIAENPALDRVVWGVYERNKTTGEIELLETAEDYQEALIQASGYTL